MCEVKGTFSQSTKHLPVTWQWSRTRSSLRGFWQTQQLTADWNAMVSFGDMIMARLYTRSRVICLWTCEKKWLEFELATFETILNRKSHSMLWKNHHSSNTCNSKKQDLQQLKARPATAKIITCNSWKQDLRQPDALTYIFKFSVELFDAVFTPINHSLVFLPSDRTTTNPIEHGTCFVSLVVFPPSFSWGVTIVSLSA